MFFSLLFLFVWVVVLVAFVACVSIEHRWKQAHKTTFLQCHRSLNLWIHLNQWCQRASLLQESVRNLFLRHRAVQFCTFFFTLDDVLWLVSFSNNSTCLASSYLTFVQGTDGRGPCGRNDNCLPNAFLSMLLLLFVFSDWLAQAAYISTPQLVPVELAQ